MSVEIEKKYRLSGEDRVRITHSLAERGAVFISREFEENTIYSNAVLRANGAIVRIRRIDDRTLLTYKRRVQNDFAVKEQIEHETEVADSDSTKDILAELGLNPALVYEKYRDTWQFRSVEIVIDELPFGLFMEIEGSISAIKEAEILLDIEGYAVEHETYPQLTARLGKKKGSIMEARFQP